jgi:hypothetical protein
MHSGSRKHILDWVERVEFTSELTALLKPTGAVVSAADRWMPRGWPDDTEARLSRHGESLLPGSIDWSELRRWWLVHNGRANTPNWDLAFVASSVLAEGVDLHLDCRYVIHHDLSWNPSTVEQRTGRVDRIGAKAERVGQPINVFMPYIAGTQDEKMYRVVRDRERWFQVLMGENYALDENVTRQLESRVPLPEAAAAALAFKLHVYPAGDS